MPTLYKLKYDRLHAVADAIVGALVTKRTSGLEMEQIKNHIEIAEPKSLPRLGRGQDVARFVILLNGTRIAACVELEPGTYGTGTSDGRWCGFLLEVNLLSGRLQIASVAQLARMITCSKYEFVREVQTKLKEYETGYLWAGDPLPYRELTCR